mgnify:CR=1 FL=1
MRKILILSLAVLFTGLGLWGFTAFQSRSHNPEGVLEGSGRIEGTEVTLASKIPGRVIKLNVSEGQLVKKGEIAAELSSDQLEARLREVEAQLRAADYEVAHASASVNVLERELGKAMIALRLSQEESKANIAKAEASRNVAHANLLQARADLERAEKDYSRYSDLFQKGAIAAQELDQVLNSYE